MESSYNRKKPILRWAGSKRQIIDILLSLIPRNYARYIEPFAGSASLFFYLNPPKAILGDINIDLIRTYNAIRNRPRMIYKAVSKMKNTKHEYYRIRAMDPSRLSSVEFAARFIYLNRYCFNGVYRTNLKGEFNVPRGTKTGRLPNEETFMRSARILRNAELRASDFEDSLKDVKRGDFVYLDPPYAHSDKLERGQYGYGCFTKSDINRLFNCLERIDKKGAIFLLSYVMTSKIKPYLKPWDYKYVHLRRHVSGFAKRRTIVREILLSNDLFIKK